MKSLYSVLLSSVLLSQTLFANTICSFGSISNDLNEISCGGYQVEFYSKEFAPFVTMSKAQELLTALAGTKIEFQVFLKKEMVNFDIRKVKEFKIFRKNGSDINLLQDLFKVEEKSWGIELHSKIIVPESTSNEIELFAEIKDADGNSFWLNNNDANSNYKFLLLQTSQRDFILEAPLEKSIFESASSDQLATKFSFEYDPQRATDLGVEALWYKAGETRNAQIYVDYKDDSDQTILSLLAFSTEISADSRFKLNNLPIPQNANSAYIKVFSSNYVKGRSCGKNTSDFFGCDDNFGQGHKISF